MRIADIIKDKLQKGLDPVHLEVINESARHKGHAGDDGSGESHFKLIVVSSAFSGMDRIARHKRVHEALGKDIIGRIHALSITARAPDQGN